MATSTSTGDEEVHDITQTIRISPPPIAKLIVKTIIKTTIKINNRTHRT